MKAWRWPAALALIAILRMGWLEMGTQTMLWTEDQVGLWNTLYISVREAFVNHHMPYWNPWAFSGLPLQENLQAAPFYVLHWLFYPFPWVMAQQLILTMDEVLAALFAWAWARKMGLNGAAAFTVGAVFAFSGVITRQTTVLPHFEAIIWLPFCLWMWEEARTRPMHYLAVILGFVMMLLAGSVQVPLIVAIGWLCLVVLPEIRSPKKLMTTLLLSLGCAALAGAMTAFFLLPAASLLGQNVRTIMPTQGFAGSEAFEWSAVPHLLFPIPGGEGMWALGISGSLLALCSLLLRPRSVACIRYWAVSIVALALGAGAKGGLLPLVCWLFPPASLIRTSGRFTVLLALAVAMLAGQGVEALRRRTSSGVRVRGIMGPPRATARPPMESALHERASRPHSGGRVPLALIAVGIVVLEMGYLNMPRLVPKETVDIPRPLQALAGDGQYRFGMVFPQVDVHYLNWGTMIHRSNVAGFDAACAWPYLEALWYIDHDTPIPMQWLAQLGYHDNMVNLHNWHSPIMRLLNARYGLSYLRSSGGQQLTWDSVPSPLPRYWVVHTTHIEPDHHRLYTALLNPSFHPQREAWLLEGTPMHTAGRYGRVDVLQEDAGEIHLRVETDASGLLVASQIDYAGWGATVDGQATGIVRTDGVLMGINVSAGVHDVTFRYAPDLRTGMALSSLAWTAFGALAWGLQRGRGQRRRLPGESVT